MSHVNLSGAWALVDDSGAYACPMMMPTDGITALHDAGLIPDPYWGRNEYDLRWICERDWTATRDFDLTDIDVDLVLSEVDTVVTVRVNDQIVLTAENAFRSFRVNLSDVARVGTNTVSITFHSPVVAGGNKSGILEIISPLCSAGCGYYFRRGIRYCISRKILCASSCAGGSACGPIHSAGVLAKPAKLRKIQNVASRFS